MIEKAEDNLEICWKVPYIKKIDVTKEDKELLNIRKWKITMPKPNSQSSLRISFPQIMDRHSLFHKIRLLDEKGKVVDGKIEVSNHERNWQFTPNEKWKEGGCIIQINSRLEDPSGNSLNGLFEHELGSLKNEHEGEIFKVKLEVR